MLELFQQPQLLVAVLENMQDGFSIVDAESLQVFVNAALCRMTGYAREELVGQRSPHYPYWPEEELAGIEAAFRATMAGEASSYELTFKRKDGSRFPVIVSPSQLRAADGSVVAYFATIKDISERKRLERALADGHDGDELDGVVEVHARRRRTARVAGGDQRRGRKTNGGSLLRAPPSHRWSSRGSGAARRLVPARARVVVEPAAHRFGADGWRVV